jgi:hypothetical protein
VTGPAPDEEHDGAEAERESLSVIGISRPACAPGPIPRSRAAQLLIEVPPCPVAGKSPLGTDLPPCASRTRRPGDSVFAQGHCRTPGARPMCRIRDDRTSECRHSRPFAGPCAQPAWGTAPGVRGSRPSQTGLEDCLHQCGLKTTVLDRYESRHIDTSIIARRRPRHSRVEWSLAALMHPAYGRLSSALA